MSASNPYSSKYLKEIDDTIAVVNMKFDTSQMAKSAIGRS